MVACALYSSYHSITTITIYRLSTSVRPPLKKRRPPITYIKVRGGSRVYYVEVSSKQEVSAQGTSKKQVAHAVPSVQAQATLSQT